MKNILVKPFLVLPIIPLLSACCSVPSGAANIQESDFVGVKTIFGINKKSKDDHGIGDVFRITLSKDKKSVDMFKITRKADRKPKEVECEKTKLPECNERDSLIVLKKFGINRVVYNTANRKTKAEFVFAKESDIMGSNPDKHLHKATFYFLDPISHEPYLYPFEYEIIEMELIDYKTLIPVKPKNIHGKGGGVGT